MKVGEKLRYLRSVEGVLRGYEKAMTQQAVVGAIENELGVTITQGYLSQIERGLRPHLTNTTRMALARFFGVHPGYLVDDPEGFHEELTSDVRTLEDQLDVWLTSGAERFSNDPEVSEPLRKLAAHPDTRRCFALFGAILDTPGLAGKLIEILRPDLAGTKKETKAKKRERSARASKPGIGMPGHNGMPGNDSRKKLAIRKKETKR